MQFRRRRRTISQVLFCGAFNLERDFFIAKQIRLFAICSFIQSEPHLRAEM